MASIPVFPSLLGQSSVQGTTSTIARERQSSETKPSSAQPSSAGASRSFGEYLRESLAEINTAHKSADKMATDVAIGKNENIHETMLALSQAELSFKMMVQVRNKALEAYQEIMRMPA